MEVLQLAPAFMHRYVLAFASAQESAAASEMASVEPRHQEIICGFEIKTQ